MKKIISALLAITVMLTQMTVLAADDREIFDVVSLGIIRGDENGDLRLSDDVTRAEFAVITARLLGFDDDVPAGFSDGGFSDVKNDDWFAPAVAVVSGTGAINGYPDKTFRPMENVSVQEAMKILVCVLGYEISAIERGGYPSGYIAEAGRLGISDGVTANVTDNASRADIVRMIYNSLDVDKLEKSYSSDEYEIKPGETLRKNLTEDSSIYHVKGVVTANVYTWLLMPDDTLESGQIEIDGEIYIADGIDTSLYVGQEVECYYYQKSKASKKYVKSIVPTSENTVIEFESDLYDGFENNEISYFENEDSSKTKKARISDGCVILYNNRVLEEYSQESLEIENGSYRLTDNNGDREIDYIFIEETQAVLVDSVFETGEIYFKTPFTVDGARYISIDPDETQTYLLTDADGEKIGISDIGEDGVLSVMLSRDRSFITLVFSKDVREITISEISDDEILTQDGWCKIINSFVEPEIGKTVTGYFDHKGNLVYIDDSLSDGDEKYGYITKVSKGKGLASPLAQLISAGNLISLEEENKANPDDKNTISTLYCSNEAVLELEFASRIRIDGASLSIENVSDSELKALCGPVIYKLNAEGKIKSIETPELIGGEEGREIVYSAKEMVFGGSVITGGFGIDGNTKVCCVPEDGGASVQDCLVEVKIDNRDSAQRFDAQGYVLNEETKNVEFLVITRPMSVENVTSISYLTSNVGIVTKSSKSLGENGDEQCRLVILSEDGETVYTVRDINSVSEILFGLKQGDLIYYETGNNSELCNAKVITNIESGLTYSGYWNEASEDEAMYGQVTAMELGAIDVVNTRRTDILNIDADGGIEEVLVPVRNAPVVFMYDGSDEEYSLTTTANIREGVDNVFVLQPFGDVKVVVIKR